MRKTVGVVGDGTGDGPALKAAGGGFAMSAGVVAAKGIGGPYGENTL